MNTSLQKLRKFALASSVCAIVSLFIGGIMLDTIGFVLGYYSYSKVKQVRTGNPEDPYTQAVFRLARNSLWFCVIAAVLNLLAAFILLSAAMDGFLETGTSSVF